MSISVFKINKKPKVNGEVGLPKINVNTAEVTLLGLDGDYNNFRKMKKKNDPNMGLLILSYDIIENLNSEGWPVAPGDLGENITLTGLNYNSLKPKQKYKIGAVIFEITFICDPCKSLKVLPYVGENGLNDFIKTTMKRRGWYAKVLEPGTINNGDLVSLI